ncbi:Protein argonaute-2, partial [Serendipita sp. 399]
YSIDPNAIDYRCKVKFQEPRQELVKELSGMVSAAIRNFYDNSKHLPTKIIFYRDGVSEGQFDQVAKSEIEAILDTLKFVSQTTKRPQPTLTFIVVGKKHHIRFFPSPDLADAKENALPGTVIDTDITTPEPNQFDFYLQSHAGLMYVYYRR